MQAVYQLIMPRNSAIRTASIASSWVRVLIRHEARGSATIVIVERRACPRHAPSMTMLAL
jgi:hypothetical protein